MKTLKLADLTQAGSTGKVSLIAAASSAHDSLRNLENDRVAVRFVRGRKCATKADLFNELSAALQFPPYFGENWDACSDCLRDLAWLGKGCGLIIAFLDAAQILHSAPPADQKAFHQIIDDAIAYWKAPAKGRPASIFHVVLHADTKDEAALNRSWTGLEKLSA